VKLKEKIRVKSKPPSTKRLAAGKGKFPKYLTFH